MRTGRVRLPLCLSSKHRLVSLFPLRGSLTPAHQTLARNSITGGKYPKKTFKAACSGKGKPLRLCKIYVPIQCRPRSPEAVDRIWIVVVESFKTPTLAASTRNSTVARKGFFFFAKFCGFSIVGVFLARARRRRCGCVRGGIPIREMILFNPVFANPGFSTLRLCFSPTKANPRKVTFVSREEGGGGGEFPLRRNPARLYKPKRRIPPHTHTHMDSIEFRSLLGHRLAPIGPR